MSKYKSNGILNFQQVGFLGKYMVGGFVAGGCFKNILNGEKVKDIDVYFEKRSDYDNAKDYYDNEVNSGKYSKSYENDKVTAYYDEANDIRFELVKSVFGDPQEVIEQFDFTITKFAYYKEEFEDEDNGEDSFEMKILYHADFFEHLHMKRLVIDDELLFPISSFNRSYKYKGYGYGLCRESRVKLLNAIHELPEINDKELGKALYDGLD